MSVKTQRYMRKRFPVEAVKVTKANFEDVRAWCNGEIFEGTPKTGPYFKVPGKRPLSAKQARAYVGSWVLFANNGFKVYPDAAFKEYFERDVVVTIVNKGDTFPDEPAEMQELVIPKPGPHAGRSYWAVDSE